MKKHIICVILLFAGINSYAQSDISMATYWYNRATYNPSTIIREDYLYLFANVRKQWVGVDGSPTSINIQGSEYIHKKQMALGAYIIGDNIGATQILNPMLTYAYRVNVEKNNWLSMGISAGAYVRSINGSLFEAVTINDPAVRYEIETLIRPDVNIGVEYHTSHFIYSLSSTHLFSIGKSNNVFLNANHRYLSVAYLNNYHRLFNFTASAQIVNRQNVFVLEQSTCFRIKHQTGLIRGPREILELGLILRTSGLMTFLAGVNLSPVSKLGYSFTQSFRTGYNSNSTHEVTFEYRIPTKTAFARQYHNRGNWFN